MCGSETLTSYHKWLNHTISRLNTTSPWNVFSTGYPDVTTTYESASWHAVVDKYVLTSQNLCMTQSFQLWDDNNATATHNTEIPMIWVDYNALPTNKFMSISVNNGKNWYTRKYVRGWTSQMNNTIDATMQKPATYGTFLMVVDVCGWEAIVPPTLLDRRILSTYNYYVEVGTNRTSGWSSFDAYTTNSTNYPAVYVDGATTDSTGVK